MIGLTLLSRSSSLAITQVDLLQYWGAAHLIAAGQNPYDIPALEAIERSVPEIGKTLDGPIIMWNPPLITPLISWLKYFTFHNACLIWIGLSLLTVLFSIFNFGKRNEVILSPTVVTAMLTFPPIYSLIYLGQISWIPLLGLILALHAHSKNRPLLTGISLSLALIKPHLLYLVYLGFFIGTPKQQKAKLLYGFLGGGFILGFLAEVIAPGIWNHWISNMNTPPHYFQTPTLGSFIQGIFWPNMRWTRYLPSILTLLALALTFSNSTTKRILSSPILLIPLSLATAPYGWLFDQVLLLPLLLILASESSLQIRVTLLIMNIIGLSPFLSFQQHYVWYPIGMLLLGLVTHRTHKSI